jgi:hypothetical protein
MSPRLDRLSNLHSIAEQIVQRLTLLQGFAIRFQGMTLDEQTQVDPRDVKREHLDPLFGLAGAFFELDQAEGGRILEPFIFSARSLGLDASRRKFRNIEWSSVHGLIIQVCGYFLLLFERAFDPQSRLVLPATARLQRFMGEAFACLVDFNCTPYKTDLDREYLVCSGSASPNTILSIGQRRYCIGGSPAVTVEENEDAVLQAFLEESPLDKNGLIDKAGFLEAPRVLKRLTTKHDGRLAPAIKLPGARGRGGYSVAILRASE